MKQQLLRGEVPRYLLVGVGVYLLELLLILGLEHFGASAVTAVAASFIIGTLVSFGLQKLFTFQDKRTHRKVVGLQLAAVLALVAWNFGFSVIVTALLEDSLPAVIIRTITLAITTVWNFYIYKTKIFKGASDAKTFA